ncbi:MAG: hypothetical protein ABI651_15185, partial [Verrucomicrobiota bacterium]
VAVSHAEFSPDGRLVVSACRDGGSAPREAQVWNAATGKPVGEPLKHKDGVLYATFSSDSKLVLTASEDRYARVWVAATGKSHGKRMKHKDEVHEASFSSDGHRIVTTIYGLMAQIWDVETREPLTPPSRNLARIARIRGHAQLIANGQGIMLKNGETGESWNWIPNEIRPVEDLVSLAELVSANRIDPTQSDVSLTNEELGEVWQRLKKKNWPDFSTSLEEQLAWHYREAEASEEAAGRYREDASQNAASDYHEAEVRQWHGAIFHLSALTEAAPNDQMFHERLRQAQEKLAAIPKPDDGQP